MTTKQIPNYHQKYSCDTVPSQLSEARSQDMIGK